MNFNEEPRFKVGDITKGRVSGKLYEIQVVYSKGYFARRLEVNHSVMVPFTNMIHINEN